MSNLYTVLTGIEVNKNSKVQLEQDGTVVHEVATQDASQLLSPLEVLVLDEMWNTSNLEEVTYATRDEMLLDVHGNFLDVFNRHHHELTSGAYAQLRKDFYAKMEEYSYTDEFNLIHPSMLQVTVDGYPATIEYDADAVKREVLNQYK